jgi:hypothetical protein
MQDLFRGFREYICVYYRMYRVIVVANIKSPVRRGRIRMSTSNRYGQLISFFFLLRNLGVFDNQWNSKKLEYNSYFDELICQTNFRLSRKVRNSANPVYQLIGGIPD